MGFVSFTLVYIWLVAHRYRLAKLDDFEETEGLEVALAERRAEAGGWMNGYVEAGYVVILGTLGGYSVSLVARERAARRRVAGNLPPTATPLPLRQSPVHPSTSPS